MIEIVERLNYFEGIHHHALVNNLAMNRFNN